MIPDVSRSSLLIATIFWLNGIFSVEVRTNDATDRRRETEGVLEHMQECLVPVPTCPMDRLGACQRVSRLAGQEMRKGGVTTPLGLSITKKPRAWSW
jgi:hypothetical protein